MSAATSPGAPLIEAVRRAVEALRAVDEAREDLFTQCLSNPVLNAWGKQVDMTKANNGFQAADQALAELEKFLPKP